MCAGALEREGVASGYDWWIWDLGSSRDASGRRRRRRRGARRRRRAVSRGVASSKDDAFEGCKVNR